MKRENTSKSAEPLGILVIRGTAWNTIGLFTQKIIVFGSTIVVARLLMPADYAVAGLASAISGIFSISAWQGFGLALVQRKELEMSTCHSIFWFLTVTGIALSGLVIAISPLAALFYNKPALNSVMMIMAISLAFGMLGSVPNALLQRGMRFREINLVGICGSLLAACLGIFLALSGYGYWALIMPTIGAALLQALAAFWISGYRPALVFHWNEIKNTSHFGFVLIISNMLYYLGYNGDYLIMSLFWTVGDFGIYYFAYEKSRQILNFMIAQLGGTLLPAFSNMQDDLPRLRRAYLKGTQTWCLIIYPLHVLFAGLADQIVPFLFGQQWRPAVPVMQIFTIFTFVGAPTSLVSDALNAINLPQGNLYFAILRVSVTLPTLLFLGYKGASITTTAAVLMLVWIMISPFFGWYLHKSIKLSIGESWRSLRLIFCATLIMGLVLMGMRLSASAFAWSTCIEIVLAIIVPSVVYVSITHYLLEQFLKPIFKAFLIKIKTTQSLV